jgi:hypothetical protein
MGKVAVGAEGSTKYRNPVGMSKGIWLDAVNRNGNRMCKYRKCEGRQITEVED